MKSGNENNSEGLAVANEAVNKVAEAVIAINDNLSASSPAKQDLEDIAGIMIDTINVLETSNSLQGIEAKKIEALEKKAESIQSRSSIGAQIKAWFNSWFTPLINFLKSPFSKEHKEELQQTTEDFVKGAEVVQKQVVQEEAVEKQIATTIPAKETLMQQPLMETPKPQVVIPTTAPLAVQETTHSIQDVVPTQAVVSSVPTMPPVQATTITPTVMPPPAQVTVSSVQGVPPPPPPPPPIVPHDPLAAIRGKEKKSVTQTVAEPAGDMMSELKKTLAARREKAGDVQINTGSSKLAEEFAKIKKMQEEEALLGEKEAVYGQKIEVTIKPEVAAVTPSLKVEFKDGIPVPPPPPPPPPGTPDAYSPKPVVKSPETAAKVQAKPTSGIDMAEVLKVRQVLKKTEGSTPKKPTETPVINFKAQLKSTKGQGR